jgi:hypothetical protein
MPAAWLKKDERQYGHILASCQRRGRYGKARCKSIAGATVNRTRRQQGRTLSNMQVVGGSWCDIAIPRGQPRPSEAECKRTMTASLGYWTPAFAGLETLPGFERRDFCLPGRTRSESKYPVPTCRNANSALAYSTQMYNKGYLTKRQLKKVRSCARRAQQRLCR